MTDEQQAPSGGSRKLLLIVALFVVLGLFAMSDVRDVLFTGSTWNLLLVQTVVVALGAMGMTTNWPDRLVRELLRHKRTRSTR